MEIEKKLDAVGSAFEEFKKINDKRLGEIEKKGFDTAETKEQLERANAEIDKLQAEIKAVQTAMNRPGAPGEGTDPALAERKAAFSKYMRKGIEEKGLSVASDPDGGYLVLPEMSTEIVKKVFESSPMRQLASVQTISTDSLEIIEDLDEVTASWVSESGSRAATATAQLKKLIIPCHEMFAKPQATQKILDDAMFNVESWLSEKVADKFARTEATGFITGSGVGQPMGIMSYASGTGYNQLEQVVTGSAAAVAADGFVNLVYSLKAAYKPGAAFMMKRVTVGSVRKLKESTTNAYIWQPGLQAGQPDLLLGYPVYEADDIAAEGANNLVAAFGNFKAGYQIVDRFGIRVLRDPYSAKPNVEFYTTKRVGGGVKNFEAIKILKCST